MKVFIMGMHRSGTSLVTGLLHKCGLYLGDNLLMGAKDNPKGHFEDRKFININNQLILSNGGHWRRPPDRIIPQEKHIRQAKALLESFPGDKICGFKDPRICLTFPFWHHITSPEPIEVVFVHRPGSEIAQSLKKRNGMPLNMGLNLYKTYIERASAALQGRSIKPYEIYFHDFFRPGWKIKLMHLCISLGLDFPKEMSQLEKFVDHKLWHHRQGAK